ncbi:GNAT family N-acetyltransferase [Saccharothrix variisporea]|uniref:Acetyltransferase (GNAT) family protein n=1 Tax=Saccharothrix variisporea TaxID=543527 RepID=A0A495X4X4_9PSEU|nr:GNAT family N-acetyltransferase [Saccharothrix variisporea]RKT68164.1 acetyltransferase (GNAT) family protein [Saccharothrix variisporea]
MTPALALATRNSDLLHTVLAETRGHELIRRPGFSAMRGPGLVRVLVLHPEPSVDEVAEMAELVATAGERRVTVEDSFAVLDCSSWGLEGHELPVMARQPAPVPPPALDVTRVETVAQLAVAEKVVLDGFPLPGFAPGEALTPALLDRPEARLHLVTREGEPAGACLSIVDEKATGLYWVTTLPEHRSRGVGRALLGAALDGWDVPVTLTATKAGRPLYDSFGFDVVAHARWWSKPTK